MASSTGKPDTLMMQQWRELKAQHPDALLLYRCGDFYEMFHEDAETGSRVLGLTLTSRNNGGAANVPLAGVPARALNDYVRRLVGQGFRVAICDQVEDPRAARGIVRRAVVETVTPGVVYADDLLEGSRNNYIAAIDWDHPAGRLANRLPSQVGVAAADISTGEFRLFLTTETELAALLTRLAPREVVISDATSQGTSKQLGCLVTRRQSWEFDPTRASDDLIAHFQLHTLDGLGIMHGDALMLGAAGALLRYLRQLQPSGVPHLALPIVERPGGVMVLDDMTCRNLELVEPLRGSDVVSGPQGPPHTLLAVLDRTSTAMGARLLRRWLLAPLTKSSAINDRLNAVDTLAADPVLRDDLRTTLDGIRDIERLAGKVATCRATPREVAALGTSIRRLADIERIGRRLIDGCHTGSSTGALADIMVRWDSCQELADRIGTTLVSDAPTVIGDEPTIADGIDPMLDELRALRNGGRDAIARIQHDERARTGIGSLKVGFNRIFGYYIEISNANRHLVPGDYQRRQTLANGERYITPALKEYEERVLTAAEQIEARERVLFETLRASIGDEATRLQSAAQRTAELDVYAALAETAMREGYVRPTLVDDYVLEISAGRHPVVEQMMPRDKFIPNDVQLTDDARLMILTGPNMAGKSTVLRQVGLIVLMTQVGSFVPAAAARVGIVDRIFTRVGASDNLARGQSTFMVEMAETSAILRSATTRSIVLLDEIGRGTSTYDGVSIAWAVSEYLHDHIGCKTIFATHYHELTQLANSKVAVRNFTVAVRETQDQVLFLHRLEPGGADRSYGIEVGRLAGLPDDVLRRAREVLGQLEMEHIAAHGAGSLRGEQLALFDLPRVHPVVDRLRAIDPDTTTPMQALALLAQLVEEARTP